MTYLLLLMPFVSEPPMYDFPGKEGAVIGPHCALLSCHNGAALESPPAYRIDGIV